MVADALIAARGLGKSYSMRMRHDAPTTVTEAALGRLRHPLRRQRPERFWALEDITFDVARGEALGVIGRNGAGKSTLLKIISRITEPSAGEMRLRATVGSLLEVGTGFHPELTGRENIYLNGSILGMKRSEITRHFDAIVEFSGVGDFLDTPVKRFSSGMSVRLAFAVAAHLDPEILVVDEVLAVGDAEFQQRCLGKMGEVAATGSRTVLFVSHNMAAVEALCSRCIVLDHGHLVFDGTPTEAIARYLSSLPSMDDEGDVDLSKRVNTHDRDRIIIRRLAVVRDDGESAAVVRAGEGITLTVEVEGLSSIASAKVGIDIRTDFDQLVATVHTRMKPSRAQGPRTHIERFICHIRDLPLTPGKYWIDIGVGDPYQYRVVDYVPRAASFTIIATDVYQSGYQLRDDGLIFLDFEWEIRPGPTGSVPYDSGCCLPAAATPTLQQPESSL